MATHSSTPAWEILWTGAWRATVYGVTKSWTRNAFHFLFCRASLVAQTVKNLPAVQETWVQSLGWEDPLE